MNGTSLTLLLVEDNPDHTELVIRSFQEHHLAGSIHHVPDGELALDYVAKSPESILDLPHIVERALRESETQGSSGKTGMIDGLSTSINLPRRDSSWILTTISTTRSEEKIK